MLCAASILTGCAVKPTPDPRNPGMIRDTPVTLRVCFVGGDGAHLAVGDQVRLITNRLGRLRIQHIPGPNNREGAWNQGDDVRVRSAVLVEQVDPRAGKTNARQFVPVGRFPVRLGARNEHARFDFLASKTTAATREHEFPECIADVGDDEVLIRGVDDDDRHGGTVIVRY
jgi:hypothetical protein